MNKKGIFFTLIALAIVAVLMVLGNTRTSVPDEDISSETLRVMRLNTFISEVQEDFLASAVQIAAHNTLRSFLLYIAAERSIDEIPYIDAFDARFKEVAMNGTFNAVAMDSLTGQNLMTGNTLRDWTTQIQDAASEAYDNQIGIVARDISINQTSPWEVIITAEFGINVSDQVANWTIDSFVVETRLPIDRYEDPLFAMQFGGDYNRTFIRAPVDDASDWQKVGGTYDALDLHITDGTYYHWTVTEQGDRGPSFLQRFVDPNLNSDCCGIESILDIRDNEVSTLLSGVDASVVDYLVFRELDQGCEGMFTISNVIEDDFTFGEIHVERYSITDPDDWEEVVCDPEP